MTGDHERHDSITDVLRLDGQAGPAKRISIERAHALVDAAVEAALTQGLEPELPTIASEPPRKRWRGMLLVSAFVVAVTGTAAAFTMYAARGHEAVAPPAAREAPATKNVRARQLRDAPSIVAPDEAEEELIASTKGRARRVRVGSVRVEPIEDVLERANRLRRERRFRDAERAYREVARAAPGTMSAYVAYIAAASIRLEQMNDPRGALGLYRSALTTQPGGALEIEAIEGAARSYSKLGRHAQERAMLERLVRDHAGSAAAERAEARLARLEERP